MNSSRELQALILGIRQADKAVQAEIRNRTKVFTQSEWEQALAQEAQTPAEFRTLVDTARVSVSNQNVQLRAGQLAKKLSGGARVFEVSKQYEFGSTHYKFPYTAKRNGKSFTVNRVSGQQFKAPKRNGYVVYQAAARFIPRVAALWTQTAVRTFHEALEK